MGITLRGRNSDEEATLAELATRLPSAVVEALFEDESIADEFLDADEELYETVAFQPELLFSRGYLNMAIEDAIENAFGLVDF